MAWLNDLVNVVGGSSTTHTSQTQTNTAPAGTPAKGGNTMAWVIGGLVLLVLIVGIWIAVAKGKGKSKTE